MGGGSGRGSGFKTLGGGQDGPTRVPQIVSISADDFLHAIAVALTESCGVLLSPTSDGGAVSIIIYDGDERYRTYASTNGEFQAAIEAVRDHAEAKMVGGTPKAKKPRVQGT